MTKPGPKPKSKQQRIVARGFSCNEEDWRWLTHQAKELQCSVSAVIRLLIKNAQNEE